MSSRDETNLARARAQFAYEDVVEWSRDWSKDALARVKGLPVQTRTQGLTTTLATLMRDDSRHATHLADLIGSWVLQKAPHKPLGEDTGQPTWSLARRLLAACVNAERSAYLAAQAE